MALQTHQTADGWLGKLSDRVARVARPLHLRIDTDSKGEGVRTYIHWTGFGLSFAFLFVTILFTYCTE